MTVLARARVLLEGDAVQLTRTLRGASDAMQQAGQKMQRVGGGLTRAVTLPLAAIGGAAFKMASDAEEAANKFDVVFGGASDRVRSRLHALADTIPLTTAQMEAMAAGLQDMLVPMGVARDVSADMSADMVGLAGDIASFNNVATDEVLNAFQSALAGMSQPMRRFGVDTRVSRLETLALEHGIISAGEEMDETARAQAVMLAIQRDSTDAMGDAARTADSAANSLRFLGRNLKEIGITIGQVILPVLTPMVQGVQRLLGRFQELSPGIQKTIVLLGGVAAAAGPVLLVLGKLLTLTPLLVKGFGLVAAALSANIILPLAAVAAAVSAGVAAWRRWGDDVRLIVQATTNVIQARLAPVVAFLRGMFEAVAVAARAFHRSAIVPVQQFVIDVGTWIGERLGSLLAGAADNLIMFVDFFSPGLAKAARSVQAFVQDVQLEMARLRTTMKREAAEGARALGDSAETLAGALPPVQDEVDATAGSLDGLGESAAGVLPALEELDEWAEQFQPKIADVSAGVAGLRTAVGDVVEGASEVPGAAEEAEGAMSELGRSIGTTFNQGVAAVVTFTTTSSSRIRQFVVGALQDLARLMARMLALRALAAVIPGGTFLSAALNLPGRARGGPVTRNQAYVVGERGPEVFIPRKGGQIIANRDLAGSGGGGAPSAQAALAAMGPPPRPMSPHEAATHDWYRQVIGLLLPDARERGAQF